MVDETADPFEQGRALWSLLRTKADMTDDEFRLFSELEGIYDEALIRSRRRLEILDRRQADRDRAWCIQCRQQFASTSSAVDAFRVHPMMARRPGSS